MSKSSIHFSDFVSLAVMLLMVVALVTGQADARAYGAEKALSVAPISSMDNRIDINFNGRLGDKALRVSIAVVTDLSHFRGEDE